MSGFTDVADPVGTARDFTAAENHAMVCAVLKWAKRAKWVSMAGIEEMCATLALDLPAATIYGRNRREVQRHNLRIEAVTLAERALHERLNREAAAIVVDALLADRELLGKLVRLSDVGMSDVGSCPT